jgi:isopenicillin N synthase-like dioxygenase
MQNVLVMNKIDSGNDVYTEIPTLDLGPYMAGEEGALQELGEKVRHIQENLGFWAVINHGVSWEKLARVYEQLNRFFDLPVEEKMKYKINHLSVGYVPAKSTKYITSVINENTKKDLNETLITALDRPDDHPLIQAGTRFVGPNQWPTGLKGFRDAIVDYQQDIVALASSYCRFSPSRWNWPPTISTSISRTRSCGLVMPTIRRWSLRKINMASRRTVITAS